MAEPRMRFLLRSPVELADWYKAEAEERNVSMNLLIVRAMEHYREVLPPVPGAAGSVDMLEQATAALERIRHG